MKIIEKEQAITRTGNKKIFYKILSDSGRIYDCSIERNGEELIAECTCMHATWEIMRKEPTGKLCKHIRFLLPFAKKELENDT